MRLKIMLVSIVALISTFLSFIFLSVLSPKPLISPSILDTKKILETLQNDLGNKSTERAQVQEKLIKTVSDLRQLQKRRDQLDNDIVALRHKIKLIASDSGDGNVTEASLSESESDKNDFFQQTKGLPPEEVAKKTNEFFRKQVVNLKSQGNSTYVLYDTDTLFDKQSKSTRVQSRLVEPLLAVLASIKNLHISSVAFDARTKGSSEIESVKDFMIKMYNLKPEKISFVDSRHSEVLQGNAFPMGMTIQLAGAKLSAAAAAEEEEISP